MVVDEGNVGGNWYIDHIRFSRGNCALQSRPNGPSCLDALTCGAVRLSNLYVIWILELRPTSPTKFATHHHVVSPITAVIEDDNYDLGSALYGNAKLIEVVLNCAIAGSDKDVARWLSQFRAYSHGNCGPEQALAK